MEELFLLRAVTNLLLLHQNQPMNMAPHCGRPILAQLDRLLSSLKQLRIVDNLGPIQNETGWLFSTLIIQLIDDGQSPNLILII